MKKILIVAVVALAAIALFTWVRKTSDYQPLEKLLIVGTSADFPPFSFRDKDDAITGFDIDVIKEIAKRLSLEISLQDKPFSTLLPQLELGQIHVIAAGMTPTPERAQRVNFTKPYLSSNPLLIVTLQSNPAVTSLEDLKGKDVIVNTGYTADLYMSKIPGINIVRLPKVADALAALDQGKGYAFVTASFTLKPYVKDDDKRYNYFRVQETDELSALGISKKLPEEFTEKVQKALDTMEADGTLDALKRKWEVV
jgi:arginine/lysine/histidine transporter system substrate-binding protein